MGLRVCIIAASEIPIVGGDNCVLLPLLDVFPARSERTGLGISGLVTWPILMPDEPGIYGTCLAYDRGELVRP